MGQKAHPIGLRLGIIKDWNGRWFANKKEFVELVHEDRTIRGEILGRFKQAGISRIELERAASRVKVIIHTAKPGMVIGKGGSEVDRLRKDLEAKTDKQVQINIVEIKAPELDAQLVAENIAFQLERRISFRRAMRQAQQRAVRLGAKGIKIRVAGRLNGGEIARDEWTSEGSVPLHTLRGDVDYGLAEANTTFGQIGVKVWIYKGEVLNRKSRVEAAQGGR
ncbi:MAG TPA: 30S ribosomal protein S3 [Limnochordia bacterium]|nr:30S ribosomal protein S3 [Limnochordia bacterium]